jgi:mercuric ion binding protein
MAMSEKPKPARGPVGTVRAGLAAAMLALALATMPGASAQTAGATYRVHVAGLACPFCAYGIEKSLGGIDGVKSVETHIRDGVVVVEMADGKTLDRAAAEKAVRDAGFTLDGFEPVPGAAESGKRQE